MCKIISEMTHFYAEEGRGVGDWWDEGGQMRSPEEVACELRPE